MMNKNFFLILAFISLNAGAALFASDEEKEQSNTTTAEVAVEEASKELAPSNCGCTNE